MSPVQDRLFSSFHFFLFHSCSSVQPIKSVCILEHQYLRQDMLVNASNDRNEHHKQGMSDTHLQQTRKTRSHYRGCIIVLKNWIHAHIFSPKSFTQGHVNKLANCRHVGNNFYMRYMSSCNVSNYSVFNVKVKKTSKFSDTDSLH